MHVVQDQAAKAGQQKPEQPQNTTGSLFWFVLGVGGGAVAMHMIARKMQEYAGGMYSKRAQMQARLDSVGMQTELPGGRLGQRLGEDPYARTGGPVAVDLDDDDGGFF